MNTREPRTSSDLPLEERPWTPLSVEATTSLFAAFPGRWWIAGGWAIDLFVGRQTRKHSDIDVLVIRDDQLHLFDTLAEWELFAADPPGTLRPWHGSGPLPPEVHDIWCRPAADAPWALQIMLMDTVEDRWVFRRDRRIGGTLASMTRERDGAPYLAPEVQLLFKSKGRRPRDEADLIAALPHLDGRQRQWLRDALELHDPANPWIGTITNAIQP